MSRMREERLLVKGRCHCRVWGRKANPLSTCIWRERTFGKHSLSEVQQLIRQLEGDLAHVREPCPFLSVVAVSRLPSLYKLALQSARVFHSRSF